MFFAELITKAVKNKKRKCFLNSNDFDNNNERNPCFNSYSEKRKKNIFSRSNIVLQPWSYHVSNFTIYYRYVYSM